MYQSYPSYPYHFHHSHPSAYTGFHDSYMLEDPFSVLGHTFHVPDKNFGSGVKEGKISNLLSENLGIFSNPMYSILLLSLDKEITLQKIEVCASSHPLKKETLNLEDS